MSSSRSTSRFDPTQDLLDTLEVLLSDPGPYTHLTGDMLVIGRRLDYEVTIDGGLVTARMTNVSTRDYKTVHAGDLVRTELVWYPGGRRKAVVLAVTTGDVWKLAPGETITTVPVELRGEGRYVARSVYVPVEGAPIRKDETALHV